MADKVSIALDGGSLKVQAGLTVKEILELSGYKISKYPVYESRQGGSLCQRVWEL